MSVAEDGGDKSAKNDGIRSRARPTNAIALGSDIAFFAQGRKMRNRV
jgi:hypothetical protein